MQNNIVILALKKCLWHLEYMYYHKFFFGTCIVKVSNVSNSDNLHQCDICHISHSYDLWGIKSFFKYLCSDENYINFQKSNLRNADKF